MFVSLSVLWYYGKRVWATEVLSRDLDCELKGDWIARSFGLFWIFFAQT